MKLTEPKLPCYGFVTSQHAEAANSGLLALRSMGIISASVNYLQRLHQQFARVKRDIEVAIAEGSEVVNWRVKKCLDSTKMDSFGAVRPSLFTCILLSCDADGVTASVERNVSFEVIRFKVSLLQLSGGCDCGAWERDGAPCEHAVLVWENYEFLILRHNESKPKPRWHTSPTPALNIKRAVYYDQAFHLATMAKAFASDVVVPSVDLTQLVPRALFPPANDSKSTVSRRLRRLTKKNVKTEANRVQREAKQKQVLTEGCVPLRPDQEGSIALLGGSVPGETASGEAASAIGANPAMSSSSSGAKNQGKKLGKDEGDKIIMDLFAKHNRSLAIGAKPPHLEDELPRGSDYFFKAAFNVGPNFGIRPDDVSFSLMFEGITGTEVPRTMTWVYCRDIAPMFSPVEDLQPLSFILAKPPLIHKYYPAYVTAVNGDGTFSVLFNDGDYYTRLPLSSIQKRDVSAEADANAIGYATRSLRHAVVEKEKELEAVKAAIAGQVPPPLLVGSKQVASIKKPLVCSRCKEVGHKKTSCPDRSPQSLLKEIDISYASSLTILTADELKTLDRTFTGTKWQICPECLMWRYEVQEPFGECSELGLGVQCGLARYDCELRATPEEIQEFGRRREIRSDRPGNADAMSESDDSEADEDDKTTRDLDDDKEFWISQFSNIVKLPPLVLGGSKKRSAQKTFSDAAAAAAAAAAVRVGVGASSRGRKKSRPEEDDDDEDSEEEEDGGTAIDESGSSDTDWMSE